MPEISLGVVYFIQAQGVGLIKIGFTARNPRVRLASLRTGSPVPLVPLGFVTGLQNEEGELHTRFIASRAHGEWFHPTPDLLAFIDEFAFPWDSLPRHGMPTADLKTPGWKRRVAPVKGDCLPLPGSVFRQKFRKPDGSWGDCRKWYGEYRDENGKLRRKTLDVDLDVSLAMLSKLREAARKATIRKLTRIG